MVLNMAVEENLSKNYYRSLILLIKYLPFLITLCYIANTISSYFNYTIEVLSNIAGMSLLTWIFMYIASLVFKFCFYHRLFLWYIFVDDSINIIDYYVCIPLSVDRLFMIHNVLIGVLLFLILYVYVKNHKRSFAKNSI